MTQLDRRKFLLAGATAAAALPPAIARALAIQAHVRTGTIGDVEHVVILTQENRSFDHYFGAMNGVRGFADRFPIPVADSDQVRGKTNWTQLNTKRPDGPRAIAPFHLNTAQTFSHMRVEGTPHNWTDAQAAWAQGRMDRWPEVKTEHAMGYYRGEDIPFQFALADAFTLCDAYHCAMQVGTNSNRLFLWSGTNDGAGKHGGPSLSNSHDRLVADGGAPDSYRWTTYVERLSGAGISWRNYQDMADNFTDNPLAGFQAFREACAKAPGSNPDLADRGFTTRKLDALRADVLAGTLPQVSFIIAGQKDSEHPGPSSPAQGAAYTAQVLDALTADPKVWSKTVLFVNFDENDGFFDHVPPPAPPSRDAAGALAGASSVDTAGEYHLVRASPADAMVDLPQFMGRPYGLGPRVPMYVISPWSRGGWVNSQVFDHTSVIRFLEQRFGVAEPNISPWRRAVCGDLTSAFNFKTPNDAPFMARLPDTAALAASAAALPGRTTPPTPSVVQAPVQASGPRPSRALPYVLDVQARIEAGRVGLGFRNLGKAGAVFHVYDRRHLDRVPRRYTLEAGKQAAGDWETADDGGAYDIWVLGPNGFHRHFIGDARAPEPEVRVSWDRARSVLTVSLQGDGSALVSPNAYAVVHQPWRAELTHGGAASRAWPLKATGGWYDLSVTSPAAPGFLRRLAGRLETGADSISDPAMAGPALMDQPARA